MKKDTLVDFLSVRGNKNTGTKTELVALAFSAVELGMGVVSSSEDQTRKLKSDYQSRLDQNSISIDPKTIKEDKKINDEKLWPPIDLGKIFAYILRLEEFDYEYIGKYKDQKAFSYYDSGFVDTILFHDSGSDLIFLYCKVQASMSITEHRDLWIAVKKNGTIITSWCSCMAGTSECCNHIIATLYKAEHAYTHGYTNPASTSLPREWNNSTRRHVEAKRISEVVVRKKLRSTAKDSDDNREEYRSLELYKFDPRKPFHRRTTDQQYTGLLVSLNKTNPGAVLFKSVESLRIDPWASEFNIPDQARSIAEGNWASDDSMITSFLCNLAIGPVRQAQLEKATRGQTSNHKWRDARKGRITASQHHAVYTKVNAVVKATGILKPKTTPLAAKLIYRDSEDLSSIDAVKWGVDHEQVALKLFYAQEATKHRDFKLSEIGLVVDANRAYIGASPDAIMTCSCHGKTTIEIKCPYSIKDISIDEGVDLCEFLENKNENSVTLKRSHKYYTQVISQIHLADAAFGYFVVWTAKPDILVIPIEKDLVHWNSISVNLEIFFKSFMMKTLLGLDTIEFCGSCGTVLLNSEEIQTKRSRH